MTEIPFRRVLVHREMEFCVIEDSESSDLKMSFFSGMGYALESVIWKSEKQGWEAKTSLASPVDIPSHTQPVIPGGLLSSRARFRFAG